MLLTVKYIINENVDVILNGAQFGEIKIEKGVRKLLKCPVINLEKFIPFI